MPVILKVNALTKSFGKVMAVHDLAIEVERGEILGIIGPNGAGKTTLFNLISGEIKPDAGEVIFNETDIAFDPTYKKCRAGIARTYQIPRPFLNMTVLENVLVGSIFGAGRSYKDSKRRCAEVLELCGLSDKSRILVGTLPLLDRKRLELAKALATHPTILLVDEVAGGLTEGEVEEFLSIIHGVRKEGITVLWVEHIVMAMTKGPDRLMVMNFGRKLFVGKPNEAFESPEVQQIYLGDED